MEIKHDYQIKNIPRGSDAKYGYAAQSEATVAAYMSIDPGSDDPKMWEQAAQCAYNKQMPIFVGGGLTNTLPLLCDFDEKGVLQNRFNGLYVSYNNCSPGQSEPQSRSEVVAIKDGLAHCRGSVALRDVVEIMCCDFGQPMHYLAGIPGTVGPAVTGNSGHSLEGTSISDFVAGVTCYDLKSQEKRFFNIQDMSDVSREQFFGPRRSWLSEQNSSVARFVVTDVALKMSEPNDKIRGMYNRVMERRASKNKEGEGTAGSPFVNSQVSAEAARIFIEEMLNGERTDKKVLMRDLIKAIPEELWPAFKHVGLTDHMAFIYVNAALDGQKGSSLDVQRDFVTSLNWIKNYVLNKYAFTPTLEIILWGANGSMKLDEACRDLPGAKT